MDDTFMTSTYGHPDSRLNVPKNWNALQPWLQLTLFATGGIHPKLLHVEDTVADLSARLSAIESALRDFTRIFSDASSHRQPSQERPTPVPAPAPAPAPSVDRPSQVVSHSTKTPRMAMRPPPISPDDPLPPRFVTPSDAPMRSTASDVPMRSATDEGTVRSFRPKDPPPQRKIKKLPLYTEVRKRELIDPNPPSPDAESWRHLFEEQPPETVSPVKSGSGTIRIRPRPSVTASARSEQPVASSSKEPIASSSKAVASSSRHPVASSSKDPMPKPDSSKKRKLDESTVDVPSKTSEIPPWTTTICCDRCSQWWHAECANIPPDDRRLTSSSAPFYCKRCLRKPSTEVVKPVNEGGCGKTGCKHPIEPPEGEYVVEKFIGKRISRKGDSPKVYYLVKWEGWPAKDGQWMSNKELTSFQKLSEIFDVEAAADDATWIRNPPHDLLILLKEATDAGWPIEIL